MALDRVKIINFFFFFCVLNVIIGVDRRRVTRGMTMGQKVSGGVKGLSGREGSHSSLGAAKSSNSRHDIPHDFTKPSRLEALLDMPPTSRYQHFFFSIIFFLITKLQFIKF